MELGRASFSGETCGKPQALHMGLALHGAELQKLFAAFKASQYKVSEGGSPYPLPQGARTGVEHPGRCCGRSPGHKPLKIRSKASCPCHEAALEGATICPPFPQGEAEGGRARPRAGPAGGNVAAPTGTARPRSRPLPARINARSCWTLRSVIGCLCEQRLSLGP